MQLLSGGGCQAVAVRRSLSGSHCQAVAVRQSLSGSHCHTVTVTQSLSRGRCHAVTVTQSLSGSRCQAVTVMAVTLSVMSSWVNMDTVLLLCSVVKIEQVKEEDLSGCQIRYMLRNRIANNSRDAVST